MNVREAGEIRYAHEELDVSVRQVWGVVGNPLGVSFGCGRWAGDEFAWFSHCTARVLTMLFFSDFRRYSIRLG